MHFTFYFFLSTNRADLSLFSGGVYTGYSFSDRLFLSFLCSLVKGMTMQLKPIWAPLSTKTESPSAWPAFSDSQEPPWHLAEPRVRSWPFLFSLSPKQNRAALGRHHLRRPRAAPQRDVCFARYVQRSFKTQRCAEKHWTSKKRRGFFFVFFCVDGKADWILALFLKDPRPRWFIILPDSDLFHNMTLTMWPWLRRGAPIERYVHLTPGAERRRLPTSDDGHFRRTYKMRTLTILAQQKQFTTFFHENRNTR